MPGFRLGAVPRLGASGGAVPGAVCLRCVCACVCAYLPTYLPGYLGTKKPRGFRGCALGLSAVVIQPPCPERPGFSRKPGERFTGFCFLNHPAEKLIFPGERFPVFYRVRFPGFILQRRQALK